MAVILAAGRGTRLGDQGVLRPKGFLRLGGRSIIEESLDKLRRVGIERVLIVTGHESRWYEDLAARSEGFVDIVHNSRYANSGSMYSLYCARDRVNEDFLLLESDLAYEQKAVALPLACAESDCIVLSTLTNSHDEVFVETAAGNLVGMSKDRDSLGAVAGELVGITKVSTALFARMIAAAEKAFKQDLNVDYETDCLVSVASDYPVHCHTATDLAWTEIDDAIHLRRAQAEVYPRILSRDAGSVG